MSDFPMKNITIYHKDEKGVYKRYNKTASIRHTSMLSKDKYGFTGNENAIIRVFDVKGYNNSIHIKNTSSVLNCPLNSFLGETWKIKKGDFVVNGQIHDDLNNSNIVPFTYLQGKYGKENIFKITTINVLIYQDEELEELNHVKLGCI